MALVFRKTSTEMQSGELCDALSCGEAKACAFSSMQTMQYVVRLHSKIVSKNSFEAITLELHIIYVIPIYWSSSLLF